MRLIVREHEEVRVVAQRQPGERALTQTEADTLWRVCERHRPGTFSWTHRAVRFSHYCGVIQAGMLVVEILPKIAEDDDFDRRVLLQMIDLACRFPVKEQDADQLSVGSPHLLAALMRWFCEELFAQFRQGLLRAYVTEADALPTVRGRWRPDVDACRHPGRPDRLQCEYDELTVDNPHNQALKAALRCIQPAARGLPALSVSVSTLLATLADVRDVRVDAATLDRLPSTRLTRRYERALMMARWFLAGASPDLQHGAQSALALIFDMNALFQATLAAAVRRVAPVGLTVHENGPGRHLAVDTQGARRVPLKPDLTLMEGDKAVAIIDAKWKRLKQTQSGTTSGLSSADVYQLHAYATAYDCACVALWYPAPTSAPGDADPLARPTYRWLKPSPPDPAPATLAVDWLDLNPSTAPGAPWRQHLLGQVEAGLKRLMG